MDKIIIKDFEIYANHGVHNEEKTLGQMFIISVEITANVEAAALSDDLKKTIHYGHLCSDIEQFVKASTYDLIETVALNTIKMLFEKYPMAQSIKFTIKKPWAPIAKHLKYVAVEMERTREEIDNLER